MNSNNINISEIENVLYSLLKNKVSKQVYATTLPDTTSVKWQDMCLIDCENVNDYNALGVGTILIWLYAKPKSDGTKNLPLMSKMEKALNEVLNNANVDGYKFNRMNTYTEYDTDRKWHCNIVELNIKVY